MRTLIGKIRVKIHDEEQITYDDDEILDAINLGLRFVRRTIMEIQPELLMEEHRGELESGESEIELDRIPIQIVEMSVGDELREVRRWLTNERIYHNRELIYGSGTRIYSLHEERIYKEKQIRATNLQHITDRNKEGKPRSYYRMGRQKIRVYPIPEKVTGYTIRSIDDLEELGIEDKSPLMTDFDDFLIEYAVVRLSLENEYDMTQEQQIFGNIAQQITRSLLPSPSSVQLRGYW